MSTPEVKEAKASIADLRSESALHQTIDPDEMDWDAYAVHYDHMCLLNPAYEENLRRLIERLDRWKIGAEAKICDLGAGTGNFISRMADVLPDAVFWHVDSDTRMTELAVRKYEMKGLEKVNVIRDNVHQVNFDPESFDLIVCVNALYAFSSQPNVLIKMRTWLKDNGRLFIIDMGRRQNTLDWTFYMFFQSLRSRRIRQYFRTLIEGRELLKQNRRTAKGQASGRYWLHSTEDFGLALDQAGFRVEELSTCYRGYADFAVCVKHSSI